MNKKKIAFAYEGQTYFPTIRDIGRTDVNWAYALNATMINHRELSKYPDNSFDILIYIVPKRTPYFAMPVFSRVAKKVGAMQEGDHDNWQDYPVHMQIEYLEFLAACDFILCHNERDEKYYSGLFDKPIHILRTLMLIDNLNLSELQNVQRSENVMIGGTMCKWYSGMDSYLVANTISNSISAPAMGRKKDEEDSLEVNWLNYTNWTNWMQNLSKSKYAVHLMRTYAAGSFPLNCAALKIPCIGWKGTDTQLNLFPELTFDEGDMVSAIKAAKHLKNNELFYKHCVEFAFKQTQDIYSKETFIEDCDDFFDRV